MSSSTSSGSNNFGKNVNIYKDRNQKGKSACFRCGYTHKIDQCPAKGKTCLKCNKYNHFASQCNSHKFVASLESGTSPSDEMKETDTLFLGCVQQSSVSCEDWTVKVLVNDYLTVTFKIDSGAQANVINVDTLGLLDIDRRNLLTTATKLISYSGLPLDVLGKCPLKVSHKENSLELDFFVVNTKSPCILGLSSSVLLNLIKKVDETRCVDILSDFPDLLKGVGCIRGEHDILIKQNANPVIHSPRRVPIAVKPRLHKKLQELEKIGIVKKVSSSETTEWVNSLVIVSKKDGDVRLCIDPKDLNEVVVRQPFNIPTFEEIVSKLSGATVFSTLDTKNGFYHVKLTEKSSKLCTFNTPFGRYRFLRLPYGLVSSSEIFQEKMTHLLDDLEGVAVYIDDIICFGKDQQEHDQRLKKLLYKLRSENVKLNKEKCKISISELKYLGHKLSGKGVTADDCKIKAITNMETPKDKKSLERFLGLINYVGKFVQNLSQHTAPLRELLKKSVDFSWSQQHYNAFNKLKDMLVKQPVLQYFDPKKPVVLSVDSSKDGLGAVLLQGNLPVAYASKSLNDTQKRYSQIEKELYAVLYGCERFHQYVFGLNSFVIETDHKPLISIIKKNFELCPPRLQRMLLRLQRYDFQLVYKRGKDLHIADTLSRAYLNSSDDDDNLGTDEIEAQVCAVVENLEITDQQLSKLTHLTDVDDELKLLKQHIVTMWPMHKKQLPECIRHYWNIKDELSLCKNLILRGTAIVIPSSMRQEMLHRLHYTHCGVNKTNLRAKGVIFWPGMYSQIENMILSCETCILYSKNNRKEPLKPHPVPNLPWEKIGIDFLELEHSVYMIVIDYYSKYTEVFSLPNMKSETVISKLKSIFSRHGIPKIVFSDGGTQFTASIFQEFSKAWGFSHKTSSPLYAQANGMVERAVQTLKNMLTKAVHDNKDLYLTMLEYRNTPLTDKLPSPAEMLYCRRLRGILPCTQDFLKPKVFKNVREKLVERQVVQKFNFDKTARPMRKLLVGENVLIKLVNDKWVKCIVVGYKPESNNRAYILKNCVTGKIYVRNRFHIKPLPSTSQSTDDSQNMFNSNSNPIIVFKEVEGYDNTIKPRPTPTKQYTPSKQYSPTNHSSPSPNKQPSPAKSTSPKSFSNDNCSLDDQLYKTRLGRSVKPPSKLDL